MKLSEINDILKEFKQAFPSYYDCMIDWSPVGDNEIRVIFEDGTDGYYDIVTKSFRNNRGYGNQSRDISGEQRIRNDFGVRMYRMMNVVGINQKQLSELCDISEPTITSYVNGYSTPSIFNASKIAKVLGCGIEDLVDPSIT